MASLFPQNQDSNPQCNRQDSNLPRLLFSFPLSSTEWKGPATAAYLLFQEHRKFCSFAHNAPSASNVRLLLSVYQAPGSFKCWEKVPILKEPTLATYLQAQIYTFLKILIPYMRINFFMLLLEYLTFCLVQHLCVNVSSSLNDKVLKGRNQVFIYLCITSGLAVSHTRKRLTVSWITPSLFQSASIYSFKNTKTNKQLVELCLF